MECRPGRKRYGDRPGRHTKDIDQIGEIMTHNKPHSPESCLAISRGLAASDKTIGRPKGIPVSEETRQLMREACDGRHMTLFGVHIAENIFKGMYPKAIPAKWKDKYDFILNGARIDVKGSSISRKTHDWRFSIRRNTGCNIFALMAFDNAKDRNLVHLWMIPTALISHLTGVSISEATASKWSEYEVDL